MIESGFLELDQPTYGDGRVDQTGDGASFNPASKLDGVSRRQTEQIESQSRPNAALIHETIRAEGEQELERRWWAILVSGLAAGLSMGLSLIVQGEFHASISDEAMRRLVAPLGYTVGFLVVVLGRQQLFTENTLTPILPLLHNRDLGTLGNVLKLWALVLVSNIAGTWAVGSVLAHTSIFEPRIVDAFVDLSSHTIQGTFGTTVVRAIFAGWLIALMAWLLPATKGSRAQIVVVMTYVVALGEFAHIVAGSVECAFLVQSGRASLAQYASDFFAPTLLGNILGGTTLVALLNYGQVAAEIDDHRE
nr:formate/nitrite transporter family protein [Bradyrhizobium sp. BR 10289]